MLRPLQRSLSLAVPVILSAFVASCGSSSSPAGPTTPAPGTTTPTPDGTRTVLDNLEFSNLLPSTASFKNVDNIQAGTIDATLNWGNAAVDLQFFVTNNTCTGFTDLKAGRCTVLARSDTPGTKPRRVTVENTAVKSYSFWVFNNGSVVESASVEVGLTKSTTTPPAAPTPSPSTGPCDPKKDPKCGLPPGPVVRFTIKVRSIDQGNFRYRDPFQDPDGNWVVHPDEFVVFDSTQKNSSDQLCQWVEDPTWHVDDPDSVTAQRGSSQPFLLRMDITRKGAFTVQAKIDGVESNLLSVVSVPR